LGGACDEATARARHDVEGVRLKGALLTMRRMRSRRGASGFENWLDDEVRARHRDWRERCASVWAAYERWSRANAGERRSAFEDYNAAVELEEQASLLYAERVARVKRERRGTSEWVAASELETSGAV
jgi:hypothetical protein